MSQEELLTMKEVRQTLRLSANTIRRLVKDGKLAGDKAGAQWRFSREALDQYKERFGKTAQPVA